MELTNLQLRLQIKFSQESQDVREGTGQLSYMVLSNKDQIFVAKQQLSTTIHPPVSAIPVKICLMLVAPTVHLARVQNAMLLPILSFLAQHVFASQINIF